MATEGVRDQSTATGGVLKYEKPVLNRIHKPVENYYDKLGVKKEATKEELAKAYRRTAAQNNPDLGRAKLSREEFDKRSRWMQELNSAMEILLDDSKRAKYNSLMPPTEIINPLDPFKKGKSKEIFDTWAKGARERDAQRQQAIKRELNELRIARQNKLDAEQAERQRQLLAARQAEKDAAAEKRRIEKEGQETIMRGQTETARKKGEELGSKLASWLYTPEGRAKTETITQLLLDAQAKYQRRFLGLGKNSPEARKQVGDLIEHAHNPPSSYGSLDTWESGRGVMEFVKRGWGKNFKPETVEAMVEKLILQIQEISAARQYDRESDDIKVSRIPKTMHGKPILDQPYVFSHEETAFERGFTAAWKEVQTRDSQSVGANHTG